MDAREKQIPPPKHWQAFEDLCLALFRAVWSDKLAQKNGRGGQAQAGVDVWGAPAGRDETFFGVQCKGKDGTYGTRATIAEVRRELAKAETFAPELSHWTFATTAPADAKLQEALREISAARVAGGAFPVRILGWEDICGLLVAHPQVLDQFYGELGLDLSALAPALKAVSADEIRGLREDIKHLAQAPSPAPTHAYWRRVTFAQSRDLGPALMGRGLGPSDVLACPTLPEANAAVADLRRAYSSRLEGQPGAGKSVCAWQAAKAFADDGWKVFQMTDPRAPVIDWPPAAGKVLCLIDDAHLTAPHLLALAESETRQDRLLLSTHNALGHGGAGRGAIVMDPKRAVQVIAAELRRDRAATLAAVRSADSRIGDKPFEESLDRRLDFAETHAELPWQFCFILGGGEARASDAARAARAKGADLVLAAAAMCQLASRDARPERAEFEVLLAVAGLQTGTIDNAIDWLVDERLLLGPSDLRTPHQRFASVAIRRIMALQEGEERQAFSRLLDATLGDPVHPLAGLRLFLDEMRQVRWDNQWLYEMDPEVEKRLVARCWAAKDPEERTFASLILVELHYLNQTPFEILLADGLELLPRWIEAPLEPMGYGVRRLINAMRDSSAIVEALFEAADPEKAAASVSAAAPQSAYHLGEYISFTGNAWPEAWKARFSAAVDREALKRLGREWPQDVWIGAYSNLTKSTGWFDEDLGLDMVEAVTPMAVTLLKASPVDTFHQLDDIAHQTLRILDILGAYTGKYAPRARHKALAARLCEGFEPAVLAGQLSATETRNFQQAGYLLLFLSKAAPKIYEATVLALDWKQLGNTIGEDWSHLFREAEHLLGICCRGKRPLAAIRAVIGERADEINVMPARLAVIAPKVALQHLEAGRAIEFGHHWSFTFGVLGYVAQDRRELFGPAYACAKKNLVKALTEGPAKDEPHFVSVVRLVRTIAPETFDATLAELDLAKLEPNLRKGLKAGGTPRRAAALLVETALTRKDGLGDLARRLRQSYPGTSKPKAKDLEPYEP
ncbi:hypothetical protein [Phenylobacterium sp.]|uniref:hypothetical protein n=1 Tax=Phenylobacterium sp. TaxID=1871053 RepID=UPI0030F371BE